MGWRGRPRGRGDQESPPASGAAAQTRNALRRPQLRLCNASGSLRSPYRQATQHFGEAAPRVCTLGEAARKTHLPQTTGLSAASPNSTLADSRMRCRNGWSTTGVPSPCQGPPVGLMVGPATNATTGLCPHRDHGRAFTVGSLVGVCRYPESRARISRTAVTIPKWLTVPR